MNAARWRLDTILDNILNLLQLDAFIWVSVNQPPYTLSTGVPTGWFSFHDIGPCSLYPTITVPMGFVTPDGQTDPSPVSMAILSTKNSDFKLLQIAAVYEQIVGGRKPPTTTPPLM